MKLFIIAAVLLASVFAEPEADPKAWYASYGYPYAGYAGAYAGWPATYGYGLGYGYNGYALGGHFIGKRSADADSDAEAKPWLAYSNFGYAGYPYSAYAGAYGYPYGLGYNGYALGAHYIGKRSADSDAEAKPWLAYSNFGYAGYPYSAYAGAYGYPYGLGYNGYALGAHFIGKRSADAEAKPESWYGYSGYAPYSYGGYGGYAGYAPYAYGYGLGYGYNGYAYGK